MPLASGALRWPSLDGGTHSLYRRSIYRFSEEAFHSAHYRRSGLYETVKDSYVKAYPGGAEVLKKVKEIEKRGRYTRKE